MRKLFMLLTVAIFATVSAFAQGQIKGKVTDDNDRPVPGISVVIVGTTVGTTTDNVGVFTLNSPRSSVVLELSGVGFASQKINAKVGTDVSVSLVSEAKAIEEVIVTGVAGATTRKKLTVSVTKVNADRLNVVPATSAAGALVGKVAGVRLSQPSGQPGGGIDILLRGDNNLNVGSGPLILVDGVILDGSLADINIDDVESIEVVKGAAASALYGSRAGNGVVAITSKRGNRQAKGTTKVTLRNEVGFQSLERYIDLAEAHPYILASDWQTYAGQYTKFQGVTYPANYTGGFHPGLSGSRSIDPDHFLDNPFGVNINQQKEFFNTGLNYTNHIGISSRSEKSNMYVAFENNSQGGIIQFTEGYNRQNFRINVDHQLAPWLKLSATNLFINTQSQYPGDGGGIFFNIVLAEPDNNLKALNPDGQPFLIRHNPFSNERNPLYSVYKNKRNDRTRRWIGNYSFNVKLAKWVNVDVSHSMEIENYRYTSIDPYDTWIIGAGGPTGWGMTYSKGSLFKYSSESVSQNTQATINTTHKLGDLDIRTKWSYLFEDKHYEDFSISNSQFAIRDLPTFENFTDLSRANAGSTTQDIRARNYFGILGLDYKSKYLVDGMFRYDGSSLFGEEERWAPYYRLSGAYRITEDVNINGIEELKIRAAYGTAGIRPGFSWQYEAFSINNGVTSPSQKGNKKLKPSNTAELEFGLNAEFLKKFYFEATYAKSKTTDQFLNVPLIPFLNDGFPSQYQNAGTIESHTYELTLGANWLKNKDLSWNTNIVFSRNSQKITELPIPPYQAGADGLFYIKQGEIYGAIYGYDWVRSLDQMSKQLPAGKTIADYEINSDGYVIEKGKQGLLTERPIKLLDENGNLAFGQIGNGNPDFNMGISNTLSYKGLSLYLLIDIKKGGDVYNRKSQWLTRDSRNGIMDMTGVAPEKRKVYDYYQAFYDVNTNNSYWVEDAGYMKLREVALGYTFQPSHLRFLNNTFKGITARVIGRNLLTITDYSGYDPEVGTIRNPFDGTGTYPNFRNFAFSLTLDF
ncbi:MAG TPA: SusC/RagA family TonB-linked outer membrane protein [Chitinophagaceae bacterium]|nr:SusC/RagA family TonB-linked outer membrane protein [Chitinophagaceae bacterium]